jgi:hypothetical protein
VSVCASLWPSAYGRIACCSAGCCQYHIARDFPHDSLMPLDLAVIIPRGAEVDMLCWCGERAVSDWFRALSEPLVLLCDVEASLMASEDVQEPVTRVCRNLVDCRSNVRIAPSVRAKMWAGAVCCKCEGRQDICEPSRVSLRVSGLGPRRRAFPSTIETDLVALLVATTIHSLYVPDRPSSAVVAAARL